MIVNVYETAREIDYFPSSRNVPGIIVQNEYAHTYDHSSIGKLVIQRVTVFTLNGETYSLVTECWNKLGYRDGHKQHYDALRLLAKTLPVLPDGFTSRALGFGTREIVISPKQAYVSRLLRE